MGNSPPDPLRSVVHICKKAGMRAETVEQNEDTRTGLSPEPALPSTRRSDQQKCKCGVQTHWHSGCRFRGPAQTYESESQGGLQDQYLKQDARWFFCTLLRTTS